MKISPKRFWTSIVAPLLLFGLLFILSFLGTETFEPSTLGTSDNTQQYLVERIVDGDTLKLSSDGESLTIRLIGIDAPETKHPTKQVECFGKEATAFLTQLLTDQYVSIEFDPSQGETDRYGRLLLYIWLEDRLINEEMIINGYASEYTYSSVYKYQQRFKSAEKSAREKRLGLWGDACISY